MAVPPPGPTCPACGAASAAGARFCAGCGAALDAAVAPREERKVVSVLFVDLVGFTRRAEQLDPEQVAALLHPYRERVRLELERHEGTVEKFAGDAVMALFGAPRAHEDDAERAVRAALAIRDWARAEPGVDVRIGIATGEALVELGADGRAGEATAVGDVVNTAARLQAAAPVNGVLVSAPTRRATRDAIRYRAAPAVTAKGKAEPVSVFEPVEARRRPGLPLPGPRRTPFVGRRSELALLRDAYARVCELRGPQLVTVVGPPGIGKSRLVGELAAALAREPLPPAWLAGRSLPYGDGVTLWALGEAVKSLTGILDSDDAAGAARKLARGVARLVPDPAEARWVELHARRLVGLARADDPGDDPRVESFAAWRSLLEAAAASRPLVLVLEDLHWADERLLEFVDDLLEWARRSPLLVLCTTRPELLERRRDWGGGTANALTLSLAPLSDADTAALLESTLGGAVRPMLLDDLLARAGGNPLFAEQLARIVAEQGEQETPPVPESVQSLIASRLDLLAPAAKAVLQDAAVCGSVFWQGALEAIGGGPRPRRAGLLRELERKELVEARAASALVGEREYAFRHVLVRDVAYGQIPHRERAGKHRRAATWIESLGRPDDLAELLAHHAVSALEYERARGLEDAALAEQARLALVRAGDRALTLGAYAPAARFLRRALELAPADDPGRPLLLLRLGRAEWVASGTGEETLLAARAGLLEAGDDESAAEAEAALSELRWYRGDRAGARAHLDRAVELVRDRPPSAAQARVLGRLARTLMLGGPASEAIAAGRRALELAERLGLDEVRADALNSIGSARARSGDADGIRDVERAAELAAATSSRAVVVAYNNLATLVSEAGDLRRAYELVAEAKRWAERLGDRTFLEWARAADASWDFGAGRWDESLAASEEVLAAVEAGKPHYLDALVRSTQATILHARGATDRALSQVRRAEAEARAAADPQLLLAYLAVRALLEHEAGCTEAAAAAVEELLARAAESRYLPSPASFELAVVLAALGRADEAPAALAHVARPSRWLDAAAAYLAGRLAEAADLYGEIGSVFAEAYTRLRAAEALAEAGSEGRAEEQRERAAAIFRALGAERYVAEAEALRPGRVVGVA